MKIYLARYGQTDWNIEERRQGSIDTPLNETGIQQAEALREKLGNVNFKVCYTSPLQRAAETAKIITAGKVPVEQSELLAGRGFGEFEGELSININPDADINDVGLNADVNGIEPIQHVITRAEEFLQVLRNNYTTDDTILVVAHGIIIRILRSIISDDSRWADFNSYRLDNGELIELTV